MKRIIFGGSFDPIHKGHIEIAKKALNQINADYIHFVPYKHHNYKRLVENAFYRQRMINIAIKQYPKFLIDDYELNNNDDYSYTINTINYFKNKYPNDEIYLLIGNDQLEHFMKWKEYYNILKYATLLVYQRNWKVNTNLLIKYQAILIKGKNIDISSSLFKQTFNKDYLDDEVFRYILINGLYHYSFLTKYMTHKRYSHSLRVANMMRELFMIHDKEQVAAAWIAGLYHDLCKCFDKEQLENIAYNYMHLDKTIWTLLHGPVASYYLFNIYGLNFFNVLNAIARHTKPYDYGFGELSILDKALFCCDKLEPLRTNDDVNNIDYYRTLLKQNIDQCFYELLQAINKQYESN